MGKGFDSDLKKDFAQRDEKRSAVSSEGGSLVPPDGEFELSLNGGALGAVAASDDHPFLPGLVSDGLHRSAAVHGIHFFDFQLLSSVPAGVISEELAPSTSLSSLFDGVGNRLNGHQYTRGS